MKRDTIRRGIDELSQGAHINPGKQRKSGGGRKPLSEKYPRLLNDLEKLVEPYSSGDPMRPLRWTYKSTYNLSDELKSQGYTVSPTTVGDLLKKLGYSL